MFLAGGMGVQANKAIKSIKLLNKRYKEKKLSVGGEP